MPYLEYLNKTLKFVGRRYLKLIITLSIFLIIAIVSNFYNHKILLVVSLFSIISIISRLPSTYTDSIKDLEVVSVTSILLTITFGVQYGILFAFIMMWFTRWVSPWGEIEDLSYTIIDSISIPVALISVSFIFNYTGTALITTIFWYYIVRYTIYTILVFFITPQTFVTDLFLTVVGYFIAIIEAYVVMYLIGSWVMNMFEVPFIMGTFPLLEPIT